LAGAVWTVLCARASNAEMAQTRGIQLAFAQIENDCAHLMDANLLQGRSVLRAAGSKLMLIRSVLKITSRCVFR
jgi:general secretion pathway protein J